MLRWIAVFLERIPEAMRTVRFWVAFGAVFLFVFFGVHPGGSSGVNGAADSDVVSSVPPEKRDPLSSTRKFVPVEKDDVRQASVAGVRIK